MDRGFTGAGFAVDQHPDPAAAQVKDGNLHPAGLLGLHPGQTIAVTSWDECASLQYEGKHATFDVLGFGGLGSRVVVTLPN